MELIKLILFVEKNHVSGNYKKQNPAGSNQDTDVEPFLFQAGAHRPQGPDSGILRPARQ
jgi:hypothetical protein